MGIKTLVLDNDFTFRELITEILQEDGHEVYSAKNLSEAREQLKSRDFHLVIIDIVLDEDEDGLELLNDISKLNKSSFCAPIVFTGYATKERAIQALRQGAFDFLEKKTQPENFIVSKIGEKANGFSEQEFLSTVRSALRAVLFERKRRYNLDKHILSFHLVPNQKTRIELSGPTSFVIDSSNILDVDIDDFAARTDELQFYLDAKNTAQRVKWRSRAKAIGKSLHKQIFWGDSELSTCLESARERSKKGALHIVFRGTQDILRLPIELLPGEIGHLVTEFPLVRQISGIKSVRNKGIVSIFEDATTIKVLLIGSNTYPPISGVDDEIDRLKDKLNSLFYSRGLNSDIKVIPTQDASYDNVYAHLKQCQYHIVHYAGHGFHDENDTDESGLFFWEKSNKSGNVKPMPVRVLRNLLGKSEVRFFYLSCCVGAKTAGDYQVNLTGNDFQGIMEGLVRVGIPSVVGYRWNVLDTDARYFALAFYESLLTDLSLEISAFEARRFLQETKYHNETWASPILISQAS